MPREGAIEVEGIVVEVLNTTLVRVELPNRHRLLAYVPGKNRSRSFQAAPGDTVKIEVSPYDLSKGRIRCD